MNYKATCACQASVEIYDEVTVYDVPDMATMKRARFEARVEKWETAHAPCLEAWRERVKGGAK